ncbi:MAG: fibrobacter succinogenes major paralogous domain-containing protein, partial [Dysgonamonadaceae bacterium]|nr:fibrobacter succinogenes major paralogous domain-containing protein [Dysgonamonadaceae bacterium]
MNKYLCEKYKLETMQQGKKKKKLIYVLLMFVALHAAGVKAQVIIGESASGEPHAGAILDLSPAAGMNQGLLLPNVALEPVATEFALLPFGTPDLKRIMQRAAGMLVYNTAHTLHGRGIYVWSGVAWMSLNNNPCPAMTEDREGNRYLVGDFGLAGCWMTQNLRSTYNDVMLQGTITQGINQENSLTAKYYSYPNNDLNIANPNNHPEYGLLYTWAAATNGQAATAGQHIQGICPRGWHVPSKAEWLALEAEIASDINLRYSTCPEEGAPATKMKSVKPVYNENNATNGQSYASDENGFDALLLGTTTGDWGTDACIWSSSDATAGKA